MSAPETCANCGAPLPADQPAGHHYCEKCAAAWQRGNDSQRQPAASAGDATRADSGQCANCGAALPADQPAGHHYCEKCAAAWQRGKARQKSGH
jgi:predicted RNA-binding Zn-ribbon protein involved in translation (DUF1610 family)